MARTFNGTIWGGIGDKVARDAMLRREENKEALGGLLDMAKFLEKANANRNMREAWQKYFEDRKAAEDMAAAQDLEDTLASEALINNANEANRVVVPNKFDLFGVMDRQNDSMAGSIWDPSMIADGYTVEDDVTDFMTNFDPNTASTEDKKRAQAIIGTKADGIWGPKSIAALKAWRGA